MVSRCKTTATNNTIAGNIIGLDAATSFVIANGASGISLQGGASNNTMGGAADVQSNFIGGNSARGILIFGANSTGNIINNNYIGTNAAQARQPS